MPDVSIGPMSAADWDAVAAIYQEGIDAGMATFDVAPARSWDAWHRGKINSRNALKVSVRCDMMNIR